MTAPLPHHQNAINLLQLATGIVHDENTAASLIITLADNLKAEREPFRRPIGRRIYKQRQRLHMTQMVLACQIGVERWTISQWERGGGDAFVYLDKVAQALNVTVDWLKDGTV